jgi:hypothetical protein
MGIRKSFRAMRDKNAASARESFVEQQAIRDQQDRETPSITIGPPEAPSPFAPTGARPDQVDEHIEGVLEGMRASMSERRRQSIAGAGEDFDFSGGTEEPRPRPPLSTE